MTGAPPNPNDPFLQDTHATAIAKRLHPWLWHNDYADKLAERLEGDHTGGEIAETLMQERARKIVEVQAFLATVFDVAEEESGPDVVPGNWIYEATGRARAAQTARQENQ